MKNSLLFNFGGLSGQFSSYKQSRIVVLPVPFDKTSTWIKGADKGPAAIIDASWNMELYDIETDSEVYRKGIFTENKIKASGSRAMVDGVYGKVKSLLGDDKFVVVIGGEHSVSIGAVKAHAEVYKDLSVLHLDAHSDMRDSYEGNIYNHACVMSRVKEMVQNTVSVGIRSMDSAELERIVPEEIFYAYKIIDSMEWIPEVLEKITQNVYVTIDLDVFDSSIMPSTGTPEPGGLRWAQVTGLLRRVAQNKKIAGFDVVELCPSRNRAPDFLAAKLIYKLLSYVFH